MFTGSYHHAMDAKGRLFLPVRIREELGETFMVTRGLDRCLRLYPMKEWELFAAKVVALPESKAREARHYFFANAFETTADAQGRITLSAECRQFANLDKNVVVVGDMTRLEIWDENAWAANDEANINSVASILEGLGF